MCIRDSFRANSGGLHVGRLPLESRNAFVKSLRTYEQPNLRSCSSKRSKSSCTQNTDYLLKTMITFPSTYVTKMQMLHNYQAKLDARLSKPKYTSVRTKLHNKSFGC
eukprot:TRINITY_DN11640_c0_g1_i2.p1 TRINITY_DN11640_c0_g1~~TRINITY_DN11640_c0_g1_i2.p1  ORF type:complete len:107 (+),score=15.95 TRINITY_DN11640_c0_g1_i2:66-386(+)